MPKRSRSSEKAGRSRKAAAIRLDVKKEKKAYIDMLKIKEEAIEKILDDLLVDDDENDNDKQTEQIMDIAADRVPARSESVTVTSTNESDKMIDALYFACLLLEAPKNWGEDIRRAVRVLDDMLARPDYYAESLKS